MEQAKVADLHEAVREHVLEEPADTLYSVEWSGAWACTAYFSVGERDRAVLEADDALVGDGDPEDVGSKGGEGGGSMVLGLTMDIPGDGPDLRVDVLQQSGVAHVFFEESAVDGGEGFNGDKKVSSGGAPSRAVR
jgi:hypothetical protein